MKFTHNNLYIEFSEMISAGISERTLKSWDAPVKIADPDDSRKKLFDYEALQEKYKQLVKEKFGDPYQHTANMQLKQYLKTDQTARSFYLKHRLADNTGLPAKHIDKYTRAAEWLNLIIDMVQKGGAKKIGMSKEQFWKSVCLIIEKDGIDLPGSYSRLTEKVKKYQTVTDPQYAVNYSCIISPQFGNTKSQKITTESGDWLVAMYALPIKIKTPSLWLKFQLEANKRGWEPVSEPAIYGFLHQPEIEQRWYLGRHGELAYIKKFGIQQKTILALHRDALWFSDGTGLNFDSADQNQHRVYWVIDCYSEMILGYDIAKSEEHRTVFKACKAAITNTGVKPYEWRYDKGSAHMKLKDFFTEATVGLHFNTAPYSGQSKTIESVNNRIQQMVHRDWWFYTGQNRGSRTMDSKQNIEFVNKHAKKLPVFEDVKLVLKHDIEAWNNAPHPKTGIPRKQMYEQSVNPKHTPIDTLEMIELFWTQSEITYTTRGIRIVIGKFEYEYEVLTENFPDLLFRAKYIGQRFTVKYDPDDLSYVALYLDSPDGLKFITTAQPKPEHHLATANHEPGERKTIQMWNTLKKEEVKANKAQFASLQERTGINEIAIIEEQTERIERMKLTDRFREDDMNSERVPVSIYGNEEESEEFNDLD